MSLLKNGSNQSVTNGSETVEKDPFDNVAQYTQHFNCSCLKCVELIQTAHGNRTKKQHGSCWKLPPVCADAMLKAQSNTYIQLTKFVFDLPGYVLRSPTFKLTCDKEISKDGKINSSVLRSTVAETNSNANSNLKIFLEYEKINARIIQHEYSRQGRAAQRWLVPNDDSSEPIRLVTGSVPILKGGKILLISASRKQQWILPKGGWEDDESIEESAMRESFEEGGFIGILGNSLSPIQYERRKITKRKLERTDSRNQETSKINNLHSESVSYASDGFPLALYNYSRIRMTLFPIYVTRVMEEWPESGRYRRAVEIDEAIDMMDNRPEFKAALIEVKSQGIHLIHELHG